MHRCRVGRVAFDRPRAGGRSVCRHRPPVRLVRPATMDGGKVQPSQTPHPIRPSTCHSIEAGLESTHPWADAWPSGGRGATRADMLLSLCPHTPSTAPFWTLQNSLTMVVTPREPEAPVLEDGAVSGGDVSTHVSTRSCNALPPSLESTTSIFHGKPRSNCSSSPSGRSSAASSSSLHELPTSAMASPDGKHTKPRGTLKPCLKEWGVSDEVLQTNLD